MDVGFYWSLCKGTRGKERSKRLKIVSKQPWNSDHGDFEEKIQMTMEIFLFVPLTLG